MAIHKSKKYYTNRYEELRQEYSSEGWLAVHEDKTKYEYPHGRNLSSAKKNSDGTRKDGYLYDNTSLTSVNIAVAGMYSGTTNPIEKHFRLADEDKDLNETAAVSGFYQKATDIILQDFSKSNFYSIMELMYRDLLTYSISCIIVDEDPDTVLNFVHVPNGQYYIDVDARGEVSAIYQVFCKRSRDIIEEYGIENVSTKVSGDVGGDKTGGNIHTLLRVIEKNPTRDITKDDNQNMPWASATFELDNDKSNTKELRRSGYITKPFVCPRWSVSSGNKYGNGPGDVALGDIKQLQATTKLLMQAIAKIVKPPVTAPENTVVNTGPDEVTRTDKLSGKVGVEPLYTVDTDISKLVALIIDIRERIKTAFFADLFFAQGDADPRESATLTRQKAKELLRLLGPIMQRITTEATSPIIQRSFNIEFRLNRLPLIPEELLGRDVKIEIISSLMKAQELGIIDPIEQIIQTVGAMAEFLPETLDLLNPDEAIREIEQALNIPIGIIRKDEVVQELRALRAQAQLEAQQSIQAQQSIAGAKEMSETDMGGDNALNAVLGG